MRRAIRKLLPLAQPSVVTVVACLALLGACGKETRPPEWSDFRADAQRGAIVIARAGCGQCHEIPGIENAHGVVGPPLKGFGTHTSVAGLLPNTPEGLTRWIKDPQEVLPGNAMPDMDLNDQQARDAAAYLHTLK